MEINKDLVRVLNDLIQINNDRIEGYEKAIAEAGDKDVDLKAVFNKMIEEGKTFITQLSKEVYKLGGEAVTTTIITGKINRIWMDVKTAFTGTDRLSLLESCAICEDAAQKAYQEALVADETASIDIRQLIAQQKETLKQSHDTIKRFRDLHKKAGTDDLVQSGTLRSSNNDLRSQKYLDQYNN